MKPFQRVAFIGSHLPRRCGIATFTHDLHKAVATARPDLDTCVVAMTNPGGVYDYPDAVRFQVRDDIAADYALAAQRLNSGRFDVVCLQHEYGIFGGEAGRNIVDLLSRIDAPIVTTLHSILAKPSAAQHAVMGRIVGLSSKIVVMSKKGDELLRAVHGVPPGKIEIIPHGIPDFPFREPDFAKAKLGFSGKSVILTFGLLAPSKSIETVIDAMPEIVKSCPNAVYVVLGATHPNLLRDQGEAYRQGLTAQVRARGLQNHVVFINEFVDQARLLEYISMCDVYVTPYLNEAQMTSGTLSYSFGLGKAVVSTPYWHAAELLAGGLGVLVPFADSGAIGAQIASLLTDHERRDAMRSRAYDASRSMVWDRTAMSYVATFEDARRMAPPVRLTANTGKHVRIERRALPEIATGHLLSMCDSTGLLQHAVHSIPDRSHGYCVDDNARALLLSCRLGGPGEPRLPEPLTARFAAFVQHAWNPDTSRFRNFMSYDRRWLEDQGSQDSHARTLWALAEFARKDTDASRCRWAADLFMTALPAVATFTSPRSWAFALLGLDAYCASVPGNEVAEHLRSVLAGKMMAVLHAVETDCWVWFEESLAYDNARLPQALLQTGLATSNATLVQAGLRTLRWLMAIQTAPNGDFRAVGTESFGSKRQTPCVFDQQAVEAAAAISACLVAQRVEEGSEWALNAMRAFDWFLGSNDLQLPLVDPETGSCRDGLHADRRNENRGAESVLSYLLGLLEVRSLERTLALDRKAAEVVPVRSIANRTKIQHGSPGGHVVSIPVLESSGTSSSSRSGQGGRQAIQARDGA